MPLPGGLGAAGGRRERARGFVELYYIKGRHHRIVLKDSKINMVMVTYL